MRNKERLYAIIAVLSFVLMTGSLVLAFEKGGEGLSGSRDFIPSVGFGALFLVNLVLAKQNRRR